MIAVAVAGSDARARELAAQLALPLVPDAQALPEGVVAYLSFQDDRLQLFPADARQSGPVCVDFASNAAQHRLRSGGELIVKAVKGRSKLPLRVIDATAGLGRDSFVLAAHGFEVTLIERNALVAALLRDGLRRAAQTSAHEIAAHMHLVSSDAQGYFSALTPEQQPDVVYLDPMFAHSEKTALVKKEMRLFRQLLAGDCCDENNLLAAARAAAKLRVVVKRAAKAEPLAAAEPAYSLPGKAVRYDVYLR